MYVTPLTSAIEFTSMPLLSRYCTPFGNGGEQAVHVDPAPMRFSRHCPYHKLQFMFSICVLECAFVTDGGRLTGVLSRDALTRA